MQIFRIADPKDQPDRYPITENDRLYAKYIGQGDPKRICFRMREHGIGDDLHAMPSVEWLIQNGYDVTVTGKPFTRKCWESVGASFIDIFENGGMGFVKDHIGEFGVLYALNQWSVWDAGMYGYSPIPHMEQFANIVGATLPEKFSWIEKLQPNDWGHNDETYVIFAPESSTSWRCLSEWKSLEMFQGLQKVHKNVMWIGFDNGNSTLFKQRLDELKIERYHFDFFEDLIDAVYNCERVVGVDAGITNLAAALGRPVTGLFGLTDANPILRQFSKYVTTDLKIIQADFGSRCHAPCWGHPDNGFKNQKCCGIYEKAMCLETIKISDVV